MSRDEKSYLSSRLHEILSKEIDANSVSVDSDFISVSCRWGRLVMTIPYQGNDVDKLANTFISKFFKRRIFQERV